ncbi:unnamed protein product [Symbiodinium natans]|uniref:Uncharacterized protein n=1 Tax=Symbiodinium natans TaxID=878477 RepID=A0A812TV60_9DINO|nr:unnamed protein product [Symbiodinium natans]
MAQDPAFLQRLQVATSTSQVGVGGELSKFEFLFVGKTELQMKAQAAEDFSTVVPSCRPGYIDVTGGKAYQWTCAFYCEGGQNFATKSCLCACLTQEQIEKLGLSASTTSTANYAAQGHSILVTQAPDTEGKVPERVEEVPVGEVHDGPMENLHGQTSGDYVAAASGSTTAPPPVVPPAAYSWQTVLLVLTGAFLIIVAVSMVLVFAHRNGFLGALQVVKTSNLDHVDVANRPSDVRLSPDKLSCLRRDSQLAAACMSPKAVVAMDHLEKLRNSGDAAAKQAANYHLDSLHIARTPLPGLDQSDVWSLESPSE